MSLRAHLQFWLIGLAVFAVLLWVLQDVLLPFVAGLAIGYLLDPLVDAFERRGIGRTAGTVLAIGLSILVLFATVLLIVPLVAAQVGDMIRAMPDFVNQVLTAADPLVAWARELIGEQRVQELKDLAVSRAADAFSVVLAIAQRLWRGGLAVFDVISLLVITPVVAFYLLRDWDRIVAGIDRHIPVHMRADVEALAAEVDTVLGNFLRGQGAVCLILGVFYAVALTLAGLNFGIAVGVISGLLSFIPFVGSAIGLMMSVGIAVGQFDHWGMWLLIAGIFLLGQAVEGNILTPKLVGSSVGLHPVWVIFALMAAGALFGFTGVLLAVPLAAVVGVVVRYGLGRYRSSVFFHGGHAPEPKGGEERP